MNRQFRNILFRLPKVDLHRHLEGAVHPKTILEIAKENNIKLLGYNMEELASRLFVRTPTNLRQFLEPLLMVQQCFCSEKAIQRIAYEVVEDAWKDNVRYLELSFGPAFIAGAHRLSLDEVFKGVISGVNVAKKDFPIKVSLIVGPTLRWREHGFHSPQEVLDAALSYMGKGVVGFSLASESKEGDLILRIDSQIRKTFVSTARRAKDNGLFLTVHAGEVSGAKSVWDALQILKADRIGHGIGAIEEKKVLRHVIDGKIPLEICPTSNVLTQAVPSFKNHPIKTLYDMGAVVTINTDDPTLCNTTLTKEYVSLVKTFHLNLLDIKKLLRNSLASAFSSNKEKEKLSKLFFAEFFYGLE